MDSKCSGKHMCLVATSHLIADGFHPCPVNVMSYLEASYECATGNDQLRSFHIIDHHAHLSTI